MNKEEIVLTIAPDGSMQLSVAGICGPQCQDLTDPIEKALGVVTSSVPTDEFYQKLQVEKEINQ
jgi:hypothetical protein